jgi:hypothetical protein
MTAPYIPHNPTRVWNVERSRLELVQAAVADLPPIQFIRPSRRHTRLFGFWRFA